MKNNLVYTIVIAALVSIIMVFVFGRGGSPSSAATSQSVLQKVVASGQLSCGYIVEPPYIIKDGNTGQLTGIIPDIMTEIGKAADIDVKFTQEIASAANIFEDLNMGKYDVSCGSWFVNPGRAKKGIFLKPIAYAPLYALVRANETRIKEDMSNLDSSEFKIAAMEGEGATMSAQKRFPHAQFVQTPQMADLTLLTTSVQDGKADITFVSPDVFKRYEKNSPGKLKVLSYTHFLAIAPVSMIVKSGEHDLADFINYSIDFLQGNGKLEEIYNKYDPDGDRFRRPAVPYQK